MNNQEKQTFPTEASFSGSSIGHIRCLSVVPVDLQELLKQLEVEAEEKQETNS